MKAKQDKPDIILIMKKAKEIITTIHQGSSGFWYIRKDGKVIAGFECKEHAEYFLNYLHESNT